MTTHAIADYEPMTAVQIDAARRRALTPKQAAILDWIRGYIARESMSPTLREIGLAFEIRSTNGVIEHLRALERKGAIRRRELSARSITVTEPIAATSLAASSVEAWRAENEALRTLLSRMADAISRYPSLTGEMAVVLGDARAVLRGSQ